MQVLEHVANFVKDCGLLRYNRYTLPILTFVRKCVGVTEDEFLVMVTEAGIKPVLHMESHQAVASHAAVAAGRGNADRVSIQSADGAANSAAAAAAGTAGKSTVAEEKLTSARVTMEAIPETTAVVDVAPIDVAAAIAAAALAEAVATQRSSRSHGGKGGSSSRMSDSAVGVSGGPAAVAAVATTQSRRPTRSSIVGGIPEEGSIQDISHLQQHGSYCHTDACGDNDDDQDDPLPDYGSSIDSAAGRVRRQQAVEGSMAWAQ